MPLEKVSNILREADKNGYAVAAFNVFNYESIAWLIEVAEEEGTPVIAMLYPACSSYIPVSTFAAVTRDLAQKASVPIGLHFDHSNSFEQILSAIRDGFPSVMIDGSSFEFEENVRATHEVVRAAHAMGVDVEAELGYVGRASKLEDFSDSSRFTDPHQAVDFVKRTGVDSLAVAIGSAHGNYVSEPKLDLGRLAEIDRATDIPLVLHGGSGIPDDQIQAAVKLGINKLNIGTEFNQVFYAKIRDVVVKKQSNNSMLGSMNEVKNEMKEYIRGKIRLLRP